MPGYRPIYKRIWNDPDFLELEKDDKLLFIYLCTNEATSESGIYAMSPRTASNETGIPIDYVKDRFNNGFYKNVVYDPEKRLIFVRKLRRHNITGGRPDLMEKAIFNNYLAYQSDLLWQHFFTEYPHFLTVIERLSNSWTTVVKPLYFNTLISNLSTSKTISNSNTNSKVELDKGLPTDKQGLESSDNGDKKSKGAIEEVRVRE